MFRANVAIMTTSGRGPTQRLAARVALTLALLPFLLAPSAAYARGGGGAGGFGGEGGFGGGGFGRGGGFGGGFGRGGGIFFLGGGGGGGGGGFVVIVIVLLVLAYLVFKSRSGRRQATRTLNTTSDRVAHRGDATARARAARVEPQVEALAQVDPTFDVESLKARAATLYVTAQQAWTAQDEATLRGILAPVLYAKWVEHLRYYRQRGEANVVLIEEGPHVELVSVANRPGEVQDTVTFRITATLNDYVRYASGAHAARRDRSTRPVEYWTLRKNDAGAWIVAAIEQAEEGAHHLTDPIEIDAWDQKAVAREAVRETAERASGPHRPDVLSLTNISWSDDADRAAADLSLVDARFDKSVLEVAITEFLEQWQLNDGSLDFTSVRTPRRTVMRAAAVRGIEVRELVSRDPIVFRVAVTGEGIYYEVDRRTEDVVAGDPHAPRRVPFLFTLRLDPTSHRWTVVGAEAAI